jgi:hypothetical protein
MKKLTGVIALILLLATVVLVPVGCGGDRMPEVTVSVAKRWPELLRVLPENEETLKAAYLQDNAYMLEKITQPEYAIGHNLPMFGSSPGSYSDEEWKATLGFVASDIDQTIYAGSAPPSYYEAIKGRFNRNDIDNAARTGPMYEMLEVVSYAGHEFYSWGEDFGVNLAMRSNVRPLGRGHRLALVDDFVFWMLWTEGIEEMIDSYEGNIKSLADNDVYQLLAAGLEELDTVTAFFSSEPQSASNFKEIHEQHLEEMEPETREILLEELESGVKLKPYLALATGAGKDEEGYYLAVALANADDATAKQNVKLLEQRLNQSRRVWGPRPRNGGELWSDFIENMSIESSGRLTLAKVYGPIVEYWDQFEMSSSWGPYEPLLMHE